LHAFPRVIRRKAHSVAATDSVFSVIKRAICNATRSPMQVESLRDAMDGGEAIPLSRRARLLRRPPSGGLLAMTQCARLSVAILVPRLVSVDEWFKGFTMGERCGRESQERIGGLISIPRGRSSGSTGCLISSSSCSRQKRCWRYSQPG